MRTFRVGIWLLLQLEGSLKGVRASLSGLGVDIRQC